MPRSAASGLPGIHIVARSVVTILHFRNKFEEKVILSGHIMNSKWTPPLREDFPALTDFQFARLTEIDADRYFLVKNPLEVTQEDIFCSAEHLLIRYNLFQKQQRNLVPVKKPVNRLFGAYPPKTLI